MSLIHTLRNVPADSISSGTAGYAGSGPADAVANLIIENLDEFATGVMVPSCTCTADYIVRAALSPAFN
jgi:hypothetical protein